MEKRKLQHILDEYIVAVRDAKMLHAHVDFFEKEMAEFGERMVEAKKQEADMRKRVYDLYAELYDAI